MMDRFELSRFRIKSASFELADGSTVVMDNVDGFAVVEVEEDLIVPSSLWFDVPTPPAKKKFFLNIEDAGIFLDSSGVAYQLRWRTGIEE